MPRLLLPADVVALKCLLAIFEVWHYIVWVVGNEMSGRGTTVSCVLPTTNQGRWSYGMAEGRHEGCVT